MSIWGHISDGACGPSIVYSGSNEDPAYNKLIKEALPAFIENTFDSFNNEWLFIQDYAPPHRSAHSKQ